jgi:hypothetical protein
MGLQQWFDGIYLLGQFNWFRTGCWLLSHHQEAAILELPPSSLDEPSPATLAQEAVAQLSGTSVKYLLCTHGHCDHFSRRTYRKLRATFPSAEPCLQSGFRKFLGKEKGIRFFDQQAE